MAMGRRLVGEHDRTAEKQVRAGPYDCRLKQTTRKDYDSRKTKLGSPGQQQHMETRDQNKHRNMCMKT